MWTFVATCVEIATFNVFVFVTCSVTPFGLRPTAMLQPGLQVGPSLLSQYAAPVARNPPLGVPTLPRPTQNPAPNALFSAPGKIDVSFVNPCGVTRTCAPPSTV